MNVRKILITSLLILGATVTGTASAKSVAGDGAKPVVELMPIVVRHEAALNLSAEQIAAFETFRKENMPTRIKVQKEILDKRAALRLAILDGLPGQERDALMAEIADAELRHMQGRDRCAEFMRKELTEAQYAEVVRLYLDALR